MKKIIGLSLLVMMGLGVNGHADSSLILSDPDACHTIAGTWSGTGKAKHWVSGTCKYHGMASIDALDNASYFSLHVTAYKDYGGSICPDHVSQHLKLSCLNGLVTIKTDYVTMSGSMDSNKGSAKGTINISPGVQAPLSLQFFR